MVSKNKKLDSNTNEGYIIGVDGGGSKTVAALANLKGKILAKARTGSSHPRNIGIKKAITNIAQTIKKILPKNKKISAIFIGIPALEEELKFKKSFIARELLKHKETSSILKGKIAIGSDQLAGFRSGTDKKDGIVLNAGSGSVAHGWRGKKEIKVCGWGYLSEMGSAFFIGQKALQAIFKEIDGRDKKTLLTKLVFQKLKIKTKEELIRLVYTKESMEIIPSFSISCARAGRKGDKVAKNILIEAGKELALSTNTVIKKLNFQKKKFPLVLTGSLFKSKIILETVKKEVKKNASKVNFIKPKEEPVRGAVKLAIELVQNE
jgi:N-acetylglucosamine kinase-like BadF-type ATPase